MLADPAFKHVSIDVSWGPESSRVIDTSEHLKTTAELSPPMSVTTTMPNSAIAETGVRHCAESQRNFSQDCSHHERWQLDTHSTLQPDHRDATLRAGIPMADKSILCHNRVYTSEAFCSFFVTT